MCLYLTFLEYNLQVHGNSDSYFGYQTYSFFGGKMQEKTLKTLANVCFIKIRRKLSNVLLLCLLRIFMKQTLTYYHLLSRFFL